MSIEDATDIILTTENSTEWQAKGNHKHVTLRWGPAEYSLSWGDQSFDGAHMQVHDQGGEYGVAIKEFFSTHVPVEDHQYHYIKVALVRARQVTCQTALRTMVDGKEESRVTIPVGGWIVQNPGPGYERYSNKDGEFQGRYDPIG